MADPQHEEALDGLDRLTVSAYRVGLTLGAIGLAWAAAALSGSGDPGPAWRLLLVATALGVAHVHLYDKAIRQVIVWAGWVGAVGLYLSVGYPLASLASLGFLFVALSAFALKEQFCFRVPFLRIVPWLLAGSLLPLATGWPRLAAAVLTPAAVCYAILAIAKWRMPLHFDNGDRSRYQV
jgi:uncharacterized integral membrane protein